MTEATREGFTKVINWGQALHLAAVVADGGLTGAVDRIHRTVGRGWGTRNTFKALFEFEDVPASQKHRERAYLLVIALGEDPGAYGLDDVEMPPGIDVQCLADQGIRPSGWFSDTDLLAAA